MKFTKDFYLNDTFDIAKDLLGASLCAKTDDEFTGGKIVELEIYLGTIDKASHSYGGRRTERTEVMYLPGSAAYIYLIYGRYSLFNVVTGPDGVPHAILIRALEPEIGIDVMKKRRNTDNFLNIASGPGKLCSALNITREQNGYDLTGDTVWIEQPKMPVPEKEIIRARRIGIEYAEEYKNKLWRFYIKDNPHVSRKIPENKIRKNREIISGP